MPAAAHQPDSTGLAYRSERPQPELPGHDPRQQHGQVQSVIGHVQAGLRRTRVGRLQLVRLLDRAVGLYYHDHGRRQADRLPRGRPTQEQVNDVLEQAHSGCRPGVPVLESRDQPLGVGRVRRTGNPARWRIRPGSMRQQEVDHRRAEPGQCFVRLDRIVAQVDRAENAGEQMPVPLLGESADPGRDCRETPPAAGEAAVQVVCLRRAVHADTNPDTELIEKVQVFLIEPQCVGLNGDLNPDPRPRRLPRQAD